MNQDQVKEILDKYTEKKDFTVIFSGKMSRKVNGLYHPDTHEIIIHNKNFTGDNEMMYTAFHELAHHIDFKKSAAKTTRNAHGGEWPGIFKGILEKALKNGDFKSIDPEKIAEVVRMNNMRTKNLKIFGKNLIILKDYCQTRQYPFEDVVTRILHIKKEEAKRIMKVFARDISEDIGPDLAKRVAEIRDPLERRKAEESGEVPVKSHPKEELDEYAQLAKEKKSLEKALEKYSRRLEEVNLALEGKDE